MRPFRNPPPNPHSKTQQRLRAEKRARQPEVMTCTRCGATAKPMRHVLMRRGEEYFYGWLCFDCCDISESYEATLRRVRNP